MDDDRQLVESVIIDYLVD
nr:hypothetical protein [Klebsiella pneumoniae]